MKKILLFFLIAVSCSPLSAVNYESFDLASYLAEHPTASSYDPIVHLFTSSKKLQNEIASLTSQIAVIDADLADMARVQSKNAEKILTASQLSEEDKFWRQNQNLGVQEKALKTKKYQLKAQLHGLEQLQTRDSGILPDIEDLATDIRAQFTDSDTIYLNYLPAAQATSREKWLSSPLQIFFWSPQEKYISEYIDNAYGMSLIFPASRKPVVYQKSFERKPSK